MRLHLRPHDKSRGKTRGKRAVALTVGALLVVTSGFAAVSPAGAATTNLGTLTFSPATGSDTSPIDVSTVSTGPNTGCPVGTSNVSAVVNGPTGWTDITVISNTTSQVSTESDFTEPISDTFSGIAQSAGLTITPGRYEVTLNCRARIGVTVFGSFVGSIWFTDATHYQSTDPNQVAQATTTALTASPASPSVTGTPVTFTATVTPSAAGTVQFKDGASSLGTPVAVAGGHATLTTSALAAGSHSIGAVFTPINSGAFKPSTATAITYVVSAPAAAPTTTTVSASPASPSIAGAAVTFTATVSPSAAGSVQFKDGATTLGSAVTVTGGHATLTTSTLAVGSHPITAVFTPADPAAFSASTSTAATYVISAAAQATTTALSASPASPSVSGTSVTFTATVSPAAAGSVQFKDGASALGSPVAVSAGHAALTTGTLALGSHSIGAVFTPTDPAAFLSSNAPAITYVVSAPAATATTTALAATPGSPAVAGTPVTLNATVSPVAAGTVQFMDGDNTIGAAAPATGGMASMVTSTLTAGGHSLTAVFVPTNPGSFTGSTSPAVSYDITAAPAKSTTTSLGVSPSGPQQAGVPLTFTATVTPADAAGTVQFKDSSGNLGSPATVTGGQATLTTSALGAGSHSITAVFTPTDPAAFKASTASALPFTVTASPAQSTSTAIASNPASPAALGTLVLFTATVSPSTAAGTVQFKDGATDLGTPITVVAGQAAMTNNTLAAGSHSITAIFSSADTGKFLGSTSAATTFVISSSATTTTTGLSANPSSPAASGTAVTFNAAISPGAAGTVQFKDGSDDLGTPQTVADGQASTSTSTLSVGTHSISAVFTPTDPTAFTGSTSAAIDYVVTGASSSDLGGLTFLPPTGQDISPIQLTTRSTGAIPGCPIGATNVRAVINGPTGWSNITAVSNSTSGISNTEDFSLNVADTFAGLADVNGVHIVAGRYDFTLYCQARIGTTTFGSFVGSLWFTDATHYQSTDPSNTVVTTTTSLSAGPADRQDLGKPVTLTANVTPGNAAGAIQFTDTVAGLTTNLGSAVAVSGGTAKTVISSLPFGLHVFAATFVPTNAQQFTVSASPTVIYVVAKPAPPRLIKAAHLVGSGHLGSSLLCSVVFSGAASYSYTWYRNGKAIPGATRLTYRLGDADRFGFMACRVIATNAGGSTPSTSRTVYSGLLLFKEFRGPVIVGGHQLGATLIALPGIWSQAFFRSFSYQWMRDGHAIRGANRQLYKVSSADMGHRISFAVTVQGWFVYPAMAVSPSI